MISPFRILAALAAGIAVLAGYAWIFECLVEPMPDNWVTELAVTLLGLGALVLPGVAFWFTLVKSGPRERDRGL